MTDVLIFVANIILLTVLVFSPAALLSNLVAK